MPWKHAAAENELPEGEAVQRHIEGNEIALVRVGRKVFGLSNLCTHELAYLSDGYVDTDAGCIECPLHQARFDLATGRRISGPQCDDLRVYPVKIDAGAVYIDCGDPSP